MKIKGLSIKDIQDMSWRELNKLSLEELKQVSSRLNSAANKRLRRMEQLGEDKYSPAYSSIMKSGGDFSVKGKLTKTDIKNEIQRASGFLSAKTGKVSGVRQHRKKIREIEERANKKEQEAAGVTGRAPEEPIDLDMESMSEAQKKKLYRALDRLREKNAAMVHNIGSDVIIAQLRRTQLKDRRTSRDKLVEALEEKFPELMEDSETTYAREQDEKENRRDEDGVFRALSPQEEENNPFEKRRR